MIPIDINRKSSNFILDLYPITKLYIVFFCSISAFLVDYLFYGYFLVLGFFLIAIGAGKGREYIKDFFKTLFWLILLIFLMRAIFYPDGTIAFKIGFISIKKEGLIQGTRMASRLLALSGSLMLFFKITDLRKFMVSLENLNSSSTVSYMFLATFQSMKDLSDRSKTIMEAQKTRGIETDGNFFNRIKAFIPTFGPLILTSIADTEEKTIALESRAFSSSIKKTSLVMVEDTKLDKFLRIIMVLLLVFLIIRRILI